MARGRVNFYDDSRGFGFITPDVEGKDVFFHVNHCALRSAQLWDAIGNRFQAEAQI